MHPTDPHHEPFLKRNATSNDAKQLLEKAKRRPERLRAADCQIVLAEFGKDGEVRRMVDEFDLPGWSDTQIWEQLQNMASGPMTTDAELDGCGIRLACLARNNPSLIGVKESDAGRLMRTLTLAEIEGDTSGLGQSCWGWHGFCRRRVKELFRNHDKLRERVARVSPPRPAALRAASSIGNWACQSPRPAMIGSVIGILLLVAVLMLLFKPSGTSAAQSNVAPEGQSQATPSVPASVSVIDAFALLLNQPTLNKELAEAPVVVLRDGVGRPIASRIGCLPERVRVIPARFPGGVRDLPSTADWLTHELVSELTGLTGDKGNEPLVIYLEEIDPEQQRIVVRRPNGETIAVAVGKPIHASAPATAETVLKAAEGEYRANAASKQIPVLLSIARATAGTPVEMFRAKAVEAQIGWLKSPEAPETANLLRQLQLLATAEATNRLTDREKEFLRRVREKTPLGPSPAEAVDTSIRLMTPPAPGGTKS